MNQLLLGASIPFLAALVLYALRRGRASFALLLLTPCAMVAMAVWAIVPDLPRLAGRHDLYLRLARDPRMDIFLWHHTIDAIEFDSPWYGAGLAVLGALVMLVAWKELVRREEETSWSM